MDRKFKYGMAGVAFVASLTLLIIFICIKKDGKVPHRSAEEQVRYDNQNTFHWQAPFREIEIPSDRDDHVQKAWFLPGSGSAARPLLVSLHTWSGSYNQFDTLAVLAREQNWNYIHPDFRGPNKTFDACCSEKALNDIDLAIDYSIKHGHVDTTKIFVAGVSGGGYAALATYMRSRHDIARISAWVPISDISAWYRESLIRGNKYSTDILDCTGSEDKNLIEQTAMERSPLYWEVPERSTLLDIYAGVFDGIQGSVPITQSINFYNKLVKDMGGDEGALVSDREKLYLLEKRRPVSDFGRIGDREICLFKSYENMTLTIFTGNHEMLPVPAFHSFR